MIFLFSDNPEHSNDWVIEPYDPPCYVTHGGIVIHHRRRFGKHYYHWNAITVKTLISYKSMSFGPRVSVIHMRDHSLLNALSGEPI